MTFRTNNITTYWLNIKLSFLLITNLTATICLLKNILMILFAKFIIDLKKFTTHTIIYIALNTFFKAKFHLFAIITFMTLKSLDFN
jgi:hypothetical protein